MGVTEIRVERWKELQDELEKKPTETRTVELVQEYVRNQV